MAYLIVKHHNFPAFQHLHFGQVGVMYFADMKLDFTTAFPSSVDLWRRAMLEGTDEDILVNSENVIAQLCCFVESRLLQRILDLASHTILKNEEREQKVFAFTCFGFRVRLRSGALFRGKQVCFYSLNLHLFHPANRAAYFASAYYELQDEVFEPVSGLCLGYDGSAALFGLMERLSGVC